jgi:uncharacterized protein YciI
MLWAITCVDNRDTAVLREQHMQVHRAYLDRQNSILVLGGATLTDNGEQATGSLFIINVRNRVEAAAFSASDPFTQAGVFSSVSITRIRKSQWNPKAAENA